MFKITEISIRNKLILMQVFTSFIVLSIFLAVFIISDIRGYKSRKVTGMTALAHVIGMNSIPTFLFQDNESAKEILSELRTSSPEIIHAAIIDKDGKLFAGYTRAGADSLSVSSLLYKTNSQFAGRHLFVINDIISDNKLIGKVSLEVELSELEAIKKDKYSMGAILLLVALVFSYLIALTVQPYISRRLLYLVNTMKEVRKTGNYNVTIADEGKDEISTLIHAFNRFVKEVKESQHKKDEFIGIASHELKTPLTSIKGYLDLLNAIEVKQPNKQFVIKAMESVHKLERLITDLLDVSKIQSGQLQLEIRQFNMDDLINETIASFQMVSVTHRIIREDNLNSQLIMGDRQRIEQVLINLLSNAIKYSPGENKVIVSTEKNDSELTVRVRDYGIGIPKDETAEIFERFYRTKDLSVHISGFGLGLYICRDIITRHQGRIWVEKEDKGSSFYFSLPLIKEKESLSVITGMNTVA